MVVDTSLAADTAAVTKTPAVADISGSAFADSIVCLSLSLFTADRQMDSSGMDDLLIRDVSGHLKPFRSFDVTGSGEISQGTNYSIWGYPSGNIGYYNGQIIFNPPSLSLPFGTGRQLNHLPVENIENVRAVENPLINLVFSDSKIGGVLLTEKDYRGGKPYSRLIFENGDWGYRRTQIELGRGFGKKLRAYGAAGIRKYGGKIPNSDQNLNNYSLKLSYDFSPTARLTADGEILAGKNGLDPFPGWESYGLRQKENSHKLSLNFYKTIMRSGILKAGFDIGRVKQEVAPVGWQTIDNVYGLRLDIYPRALGRNSIKISWNSYHYSYTDSLKSIQFRDNLSVTNLLQISYRLNWLVWGSMAGVDSSGAFSISRKFSGLTGLSFAALPDLRVYATGGRLVTFPHLRELNSGMRTFPVTGSPVYADSGNPDLKRGYYWYFQPGLAWEKEKLKTGGYFFYSQSKREVVVSRVDTISFGYWTPANADLEFYGMNSYLEMELLSWLGVFAEFNYKNWPESQPVPYLPHSSAFASVQMGGNFFSRNLGWRVRMETEYIGEREDLDANELADVLLLNSKFSFRFLSVNFYASIDNLTNQTYFQSNGIRMPRRTSWWGLYWEFFD